jgi:hypothetical protein
MSSPRLAYFEWSLDYDTPDLVPDVFDLEAVAVANPAFGIRISEDYIAAEHETLDPRTRAVERYGVGDWPPTDGVADALVDMKAWAQLFEEDAALLDPVCVAFDTSPERDSAITLSGRNDRGHLHVEVLRSDSGTGWLTDALVTLYGMREIAEVVCDGFGPAAAIAGKADDAGITVRQLDSGDYGKACGLFLDAVGEGTIRHAGQPELDAALRGAKARQLVDRWAWSRTKSTVNISPLVAATLAFYAAVENDVGTVEIF